MRQAGIPSTRIPAREDQEPIAATVDREGDPGQSR
jgi:hypothetical protein